MRLTDCLHKLKTTATNATTKMNELFGSRRGQADAATLYAVKSQKEFERYPTLRPVVYQATRRFLYDVPQNNVRPFKMAVFAKKDSAHFLDPVLEAIKGDFEIYRFYHYEPSLLEQLQDLDILWLEWGVSGFLLDLLKDVPRGKCKIFVRLIDWEIRDPEHSRYPNWDVADKLIFGNTEALKEFKKRHGNRCSDKIVYMPFTINEKIFPRLKDEFKKNVFLCSLGFHERKQYSKAIRLFRRVVDIDPEFHLYIKANPDLEPEGAEECFNEVWKQGLQDHVHFIIPPPYAQLRKTLSSKAEMIAIYRNMDIVLSTSSHEAFHYTVGEGMLSGLYPIVIDWEWGEPRQFWGRYVVESDDELVKRIIDWGRLSDAQKLESSFAARNDCVDRVGLAVTRRRFADLFPPLRTDREHPRVRLILFAHHHLYEFNPHGGERSMARVAEHLQASGYECLVVVDNKKNDEFHRKEINGLPFVTVPHEEFLEAVLDILEWWRPDVALTWGTSARIVAPLCLGKGIPYILFVRYWHLVNPPPYRCLMTDPIDPEYQCENEPIFRNAAAVIANAEYTRQVVKRFFGVDSLVSYVPVEKREPRTTPEKRRFIILVNPQKAGARSVLTALAARNPHLDFLVIDERSSDSAYPGNVTTRPYIDAPYDRIFEDTRVLLFPLNEEPCGTGRVVFEAHYQGIPVIAANKGGLPEVIPPVHLIQNNEDIDEWERKLHEVLADYPQAVSLAREAIGSYSADVELSKICQTVDSVAARGMNQAIVFPNTLSDRQFAIKDRSVEAKGHHLLTEHFNTTSRRRIRSLWYVRNAQITPSDGGLRVKILTAKSTIATGGTLSPRRAPPADNGVIPDGHVRFLCSFQVRAHSKDINKLAIVLHEYGEDNFYKKTVIQRVRLGLEPKCVKVSGRFAGKTGQIRLAFYNHDQRGEYSISDFEMQTWGAEPVSQLLTKHGFVLEEQPLFTR